MLRVVRRELTASLYSVFKFSVNFFLYLDSLCKVNFTSAICAILLVRSEVLQWEMTCASTAPISPVVLFSRKLLDFQFSIKSRIALKKVQKRRCIPESKKSWVKNQRIFCKVYKVASLENCPKVKARIELNRSLWTLHYWALRKCSDGRTVLACPDLGSHKIHRLGPMDCGTCWGMRGKGELPKGDTMFWRGVVVHVKR